MKKLVLLFSIIFLMTSITNAQNYGKKGTWEMGGLVMYANNTIVSNGESLDESISFFFANVPISYMVADGFQIGIIPEFVSVGVSDGVDVTLSVFGGYVAMAYNFKTGGSVYPYLQGRFGYNTVSVSVTGVEIPSLPKSTRTQSDTQEETLSGIGFGFSGGIKVQIAKGALLNFGVGYQMRTINPEDWEGDRNGLNVIAVQAGFSVFLGK